MVKKPHREVMRWKFLQLALVIAKQCVKMGWLGQQAPLVPLLSRDTVDGALAKETHICFSRTGDRVEEDLETWAAMVEDLQEVDEGTLGPSMNGQKFMGDTEDEHMEEDRDHPEMGRGGHGGGTKWLVVLGGKGGEDLSDMPEGLVM
ncbi:hypothetical protein NDU88_010833 [Pleurodeles waltl]|uniref:Uncharacterized protein n=1 Tax=Pleurodeles waltl TaxID=8319 RepID=A0AAV7S0S1_PLEWA|nr:hypothetical protein NDU88_010833 [Pleurodeles waltl]